MQAVTAGLHRAGVPLLCGSDLANPNVIAGFSLHEEMELFQDAGIPPADVLRSATIVPAEFVGVGDRVGSVEVGKAASLVLLRANPLDDVRHAREIDAVFLRGQLFDRERLDAMLAEVRSAVEATLPPPPKSEVVTDPDR